MTVKKNLKYLLILAIIAFVASCSSDDDDDGTGTGGGGTNPPSSYVLAKKEMRAVWIATAWGIDWPQGDYTEAGQKKLYTDYLDKFVANNINAVFVQIRPMSDAFYNSSYESWSSVITGVAGKNPGYDVLQFMIQEAHNRGLEFHAWMNPYRIATRQNSSAAYPALDSKINPAWVKDYDKIRIYNPALPEVQNRIVDIVKEVITKYDVDGIHFDDYFYPEPANYTSLNDAGDYDDYGAGYATIEDFRRGNVNKVVQSVQDLIVKEKPEMVFSISPAADIDYNFKSLYADVTTWCKEGWMDIVIPQIYSATGSANSSFNYRVSWWPQFSYKAVPMVGYALYKFGDTSAGSQFQSTSELEQQFKLANAQNKIKGSVMYSAQYFNENKIGIIDALREIYKDPAVRPFVGRKTLPDPAAATNVKLNGTTLSWNATSGLSSVVYFLAPEATTARVMTITSAGSYAVTAKGTYFVTTVNKDNVESAESNAVEYK